MLYEWQGVSNLSNAESCNILQQREQTKGFSTFFYTAFVLVSSTHALAPAYWLSEPFGKEWAE